MITSTKIMVFFLIFARMAGIITTAPVFSRKEFFMLGKIVLLFWATGSLLFSVSLPARPPNSAFLYVFALISEYLVGFMIGFTSDLLITGVEYAGNLMDTQAGLSVASLLDPSTGRNITLFSLMLKWAATMIFLSINGHHIVLSALFQSYKLLPVGAPVNFANGAYYILTTLGGYIFLLAVQLSAPILLVVFLVDFCFGMLNKVAEQVNVFQLGFQIKPSVSLLIFFAITPGLTYSISKILEATIDYILKLFLMLQF